MELRPYFIRALCHASVFVIAVGIGIIREHYFTKKKDEEEMFEFRAMTNLNKTCRACIYEKRSCVRAENCSYAIMCWIIDFLNSATSTIDAAIYLITCTEFKEAFVAAHKRGVYIRFISDAVMANGTGSAIPTFISEGIHVRIAPNEERHMMHRKSVVVDKKYVLSGTANWTMQSLCGNWDGFLKTNNRNLVNDFVKFFEIEWDQLDPDNLKPVVVEPVE